MFFVKNLVLASSVYLLQMLHFISYFCVAMKNMTGNNESLNLSTKFTPGLSQSVKSYATCVKYLKQVIQKQKHFIHVLNFLLDGLKGNKKDTSTELFDVILEILLLTLNTFKGKRKPSLLVFLTLFLNRVCAYCRSSQSNIFLYNRIATAISFLGISLAAENLTGNLYRDFIIVTFGEVVSCFAAIYFAKRQVVLEVKLKIFKTF